jgi:peptidyl-prolyl cis-trans isomerase D
MVKNRLIASQSAEMAKKDGIEKLANWKTVAPASMPAAVTASREGAQVVPGPVLDAVLHADTTSLPVWVGVDLGAQGYVVARVNQILPRNAPAPATADQERKQYAQWVASAENKAYYKLLTQRFKVAIKAPRPAATAFGPQAMPE